MFNYSVRQTENIQSTLFPDKENEVQGNQMTCLRSYCFKYKLFHAFHIFKNCGALLKKKKKPKSFIEPQNIKEMKKELLWWKRWVQTTGPGLSRAGRALQMENHCHTMRLHQNPRPRAKQSAEETLLKVPQDWQRATKHVPQVPQACWPLRGGTG